VNAVTDAAVGTRISVICVSSSRYHRRRLATDGRPCDLDVLQVGQHCAVGARRQRQGGNGAASVSQKRVHQRLEARAGPRVGAAILQQQDATGRFEPRQEVRQIGQRVRAHHDLADRQFG
jgi:hypothetical protein